MKHVAFLSLNTVNFLVHGVCNCASILIAEIKIIALYIFMEFRSIRLIPRKNHHNMYSQMFHQNICSKKFLGLLMSIFSIQFLNDFRIFCSVQHHMFKWWTNFHNGGYQSFVNCVLLSLFVISNNIHGQGLFMQLKCTRKVFMLITFGIENLISFVGENFIWELYWSQFKDGCSIWAKLWRWMNNLPYYEITLYEKLS